MQIDFDVLRRASITEVCNYIRMKSNPIMIIKQDSTKKRNAPFDLKRKLGSLPIDTPSPQYYLQKMETKPRSNSKSAEKETAMHFSKNYIFPSKIKQRSASGERMKSANVKPKLPNNILGQAHFIKIDKSLSQHSSKNSYFHSADRDLRKTKGGSKSKSYLKDYLNQRHQSSKAESMGRLEQMKGQERAPIEAAIKKQKSNVQLKDLVIRYTHRTKQGVLASNPSKPNQDSFVALQVDQAHLFAIADGHGTHGHVVSQMAAKRLTQFFIGNSSRGKAHELVLPLLYDSIQKQLFQEKQLNAQMSGSTLIAILLQKKGLLTCANVGDSRAILARQIDKKNWQIIHLSQDHKPSLQKQKKRILKKGGKVHCFRDEMGNQLGPQRVWLPNRNLQGLAMSRSIGDNVSKVIGVTHEPEIIQLQLEQRDKFIVIASDGVWEFIQNYQILQLVVPYYKESKLQECCDALLQLAYQRWTIEDNTVVDDITFVLIFLNQ